MELDLSGIGYSCEFQRDDKRCSLANYCDGITVAGEQSEQEVRSKMVLRYVRLFQSLL